MTIETTSAHTQLAQHDPTGVPTPSINMALFDWVAGMEAAMKAANYLVDTPAVPDSFWPLPPDKKVWDIPGKNPKLRLPGETEESFQARRLVAVQTAGSVARYGLQLGLAPEVALQGIFVIGGRYSMYAEQMVALVKERGHGHRVVERTAERCVVEVCHRNENDWQQFEFTMEAAITAGYVKGKGPNEGKNEYGKEKKGGNDKYNTDPAGMLYARASSIACKTKFPDVLRGMVTREELMDERTPDEDGVRVITNVTASDIKARVAPAEPAPAAIAAPVEPPAEPAADVAPPMDAPAPPPADLGSAEELIDIPQNRRLHALLRKLDLGSEADKAVALQVISYLVKRPIESTKFITKAEAGPLLERLDELSKRPEGKWRAEIRFMVTPDAAGQLPMPEGGDRG